MIILVLKDKKILHFDTLQEVIDQQIDFISMELLDYTRDEIEAVEKNYDIDCGIMKNTEDIEISSHYLACNPQVAFHFSIPYFHNRDEMEEENAFLVMTDTKLFYFMSARLDAYFIELYSGKLEESLTDIVDSKIMFKMMMEFLSDYFADLTEFVSKRILTLANKIFIKKEVKESDLDTITALNFNNLLIKESANEVYRVFSLFKKSIWSDKIDAKDFINSELEDMNVVSDYIQSNFERIDDLQENVNSKINLQQNNIVKILTMVTLCIALPTLIAGVYGMNFKYMPELEKVNGYPIAVVSMILSALLPLVYFRAKKWI